MANEETKRVDMDNEINIRSPKSGGIDDKQAERRRTPDERGALHRENDRSGGKGIDVVGNGDEGALNRDKRSR